MLKYHFLRCFNPSSRTWNLVLRCAIPVLEERKDGVLVAMEFDFDTKYGLLGSPLARYVEHKAPSLIEAIFDGWDAEIETRLAKTKPSTGGMTPTASEKRTNQLYR